MPKPAPATMAMAPAAEEMPPSEPVPTQTPAPSTSEWTSESSEGSQTPS